MFGIGTMLRQVMQGRALSQVVQNASVGGAIASSAQGLLKSVSAMTGPALADTQKALFMAVLTGAIEKAGSQQAFNLETACNDLWIKLGNIRNDKAAMEKLVQLMKANQQLNGELQKTMQQLTQMSRGVINNMR